MNQAVGARCSVVPYFHSEPSKSPKPDKRFFTVVVRKRPLSFCMDVMSSHYSRGHTSQELHTYKVRASVDRIAAELELVLIVLVGRVYPGDGPDTS